MTTATLSRPARVSYALRASATMPVVRPAPADALVARLRGLTARERQVLEMLARGLTNREIADDMIVSVATVKTHVANVLMKLDLRDRAMAIVFAYESGVVHPGHG